MKKLAISLVASAFALGAVPASQAEVGPICLDFLNFCDGLQFTIADNHTLSGSWVNTDCAGASVGINGGVFSGNTMRIFCTDAGCPNGWSWVFHMTGTGNGRGTFSLAGDDGVNPPFPVQLGQPYQMKEGTCDFSEKIGLPSSSM